MSGLKRKYSLIVEGADTDTNKQDEIIEGSKDDCRRPCERSISGTFMNTYFTPDELEKDDPWIYMHKNKAEIYELLNVQLKKRSGIIWYFCMHLKIVKQTILKEKVEIINADLYRRTKCVNTLEGDDLLDQIEINFQEIINMITNFQKLGSGWVINGIKQFDVNLATYKPLSGKAYFKLPSILQNSKKGIINIKSRDDRCFAWSILAYLHPQKTHRERVIKYYPYIGRLNMNGIKYPVSINQIDKFERQNENIGVNIFGWEDEIYPIKITKKRDRQHIINLLYMKDYNNTHYALISNLNNCLRHSVKGGNRVYFCVFCLQPSYSEKVFKKHIEYCKNHGEQKITLPNDDNKFLRFKSINKQMRCPYVIYADLESILMPIDTCYPDPSHSSTTNTQKHVPCGYSYLIVGPDKNDIFKPVTYRGADAIEHLINNLLLEENKILKKLKINEAMKISKEQTLEHEKNNTCHICGKTILNEKVRDHDHYTREQPNYRGPAHNKCNLNYKLLNKPKISIFFHNLKMYDSHHIILSLNKLINTSIYIIPINIEKYTTFSFKSLYFKDSFQFLPCSLDRLVTNLVKADINAFDVLSHTFPKHLCPLLLRKGIYPYNFVKTFESFNEEKLPSIDHFYNNLSDESLSQDDYDHAVNVWNKFNIKNMGEYHDLYVTTDTILLSIVFEKFRNLTLKERGLDPASYISNPGLSWDCMLKMSDITLELITDINQHLLVEKGLRGGVSFIGETRYAVANNPLMKSYDKTKPISYIIYFDVTNLYGSCRKSSLPRSNFTFLTQEEIDKINILNIADDGDWGYIFEVDLKYDKKLHNDHDSFPLAPTNMTITSDMISPFLNKLYSDLNISFKNSNKLCCTLYNKEKYVVHFRCLKEYIRQGLVVTKIHSAMKFTQSKWMSEFVDFNTNKRKQATDDFSRDYYKFSTNSVYGKCLESKRKQVNIKLINNEKKANKLLSKANVKRWKIFSDNLVAIELSRVNLKLDKPVSVGMTILDDAKSTMYKIHYNIIKRMFGDNVKLLMSDTDSLLYYIRHDDIYKELEKQSHLFDFSNYAKDHYLYSEINRKKVGSIKDETGGIPIESFVGLRPKVYSIKISDGTEIRKGKGVHNSIVKNKLTHEDYLNCLQNNERLYTAHHCIKSNSHQLHTKHVNKLSLSSLDDKRYLTSNDNSYSYGHYEIR
jgi:hypothetical protein